MPYVVAGSHGTLLSLEQPRVSAASRPGLHLRPAPIFVSLACCRLLELPGSGAACETMVGPGIADLPLQMVLVSAQDTLKPARVYI